MNKKTIDETIFIELYKAGKNDTELAEIFQCSERTVQKYATRLRRQNRLEYRKTLSENKEKSRFKHREVFEEVKVYVDNAKKILSKYNDPYKNIKLKTSWKRTKQTEDMVQLWSDMHDAMINKNPLTGEITYNKEIQKDELEAFFKGIYRFYQLYNPSYNIETFYITDLGDNITNDRIYHGQQMEIICGVGEQILNVVEHQSRLIKEALKLFPKIVFIGVPGNHGRTTSKPVAEEATNSFEFLKNKILQERFKDNKRVEIIVPETYLHTFKVRGHHYLMFHGNTIRGTTLNSIERASKELADLATNETYDLMLMGHFHTALKLKIKPKTTLLVNGCWISVDDFAYNKLRKYSSASQYNFLVSKKSPMHNLQEIDLTWR